MLYDRCTLFVRMYVRASWMISSGMSTKGSLLPDTPNCTMQSATCRLTCQCRCLEQLGWVSRVGRGIRVGIFLLQHDVVLAAEAHVDFGVLLLAQEDNRLERQRLHELEVLLLRVARPVNA
jgi:hypothetical protein